MAPAPLRRFGGRLQRDEPEEGLPHACVFRGHREP